MNTYGKPIMVSTKARPAIKKLADKLGPVRVWVKALLGPKY